MMRLFFDKGGSTVPFLLSSYVKPNDPDGQRNTCEMAMGLSPR